MVFFNLIIYRNITLYQKMSLGLVIEIPETVTSYIIIYRNIYQKMSLVTSYIVDYLAELKF